MKASPTYTTVVAILLILAMIMVGCSPQERPNITPLPFPTTPLPTETPMPTEEPTPIPTLEPTPEPTELLPIESDANIQGYEDVIPYTINDLAEAESIVDRLILAFAEQGLPFGGYTLYNADNDLAIASTESYILRVDFAHTEDRERIRSAFGTIEIYKSELDLMNRRLYLEEHYPRYSQYMYQNGLVLIRFYHITRATQAVTYRDAFHDIMDEINESSSSRRR